MKIDQEVATTDVDVARLQTWMDGLRLGFGSIVDACRLAGGTQNILLAFRRGDERFVLRRPGHHVGDKGGIVIHREARVLRALAESDVPHPRFIAECADTQVIGSAFYLMAEVAGFNPIVEMPALHASNAKIRLQMGLSIADAAARLAEVDPRKKDLANFGRLEGYLERQVPRWLQQLESYGQFNRWPGPQKLPAISDLAAWLNRNQPGEIVPGIIHGDFHLGNMLFSPSGPDVVALVDWELSTLADPLLDLGWLLANWPEPEVDGVDAIVRPWSGFPSPTELIHRYAKGVRRDVSPIQWFAVLACFKMAIILEGTYARACNGLSSVEVGRRLHEKAIHLLERGRRFSQNWSSIST